MMAFWALVKKELRAVRRERTIMIAVVIQLLIASFSSVLVVGLLAYYDPESIGLHARSGVTIGVLGDEDRALAGELRRQGVRVAEIASPDDAENLYRSGVVDGLIYVPDAQEGAVEAQLFLPASETRSTVILMVLTEPLRRYEDALRRARGVEVRYQNVGGSPSTTYEFIYVAIVPILLFFPAFIAGSMCMDSLAEEFEHHTLETLWSAPVSLQAIFGSKVVAALLLALVQLVLWVVLLRLNRIAIAHLPLVLLLALLVAAINAMAAAVIALVLRDRERSQFTYSLFILLAVTGSARLNASPATVMTRLATGYSGAGAVDLLPHLVALGLLLLVFAGGWRRLTALGG